MNPERIAEIRRMPHDNWRIVHELLDALDAANAELSRLRSSPAPVGGGVPDQEWNGPLLWELLRMDSDEPDWEDAAKRVHAWFASRLPALKPGEVVAIEKIIAVSRVCANEGGTDRRCCVQTDDHHIALLELDKIRAQPTPTEKEST